MRRVIWLGLLSLGFVVGCGVTTPDFELPETSPPDTNPPDNVTISALVPNEGPRGTTVEIQGVGFGTEALGVEVRFGAEVVPVEQISDTLITVMAPTTDTGGTVDVEVVALAGTYKLENGYTYRGGFGGVITLELLEYINPAQFNPPGESSVSTYAAFMRPELATIKQVVTGAVASETCELNPMGPEASVDALDVGPQVELIYNSFVMQIPKNGAFYSPAAASTDISGYLANVDYDVNAAGATGDGTLPAFAVQDATPTPADFTVNSPNVGGQFTIVSKAQALTFTWDATNPGDAFGIQLLAYKLIGAADDGLTGNELHCNAADDGSYTISAAELALMPQATHVIILFTRRVEQQAIMAANQESTLESVGFHTKVGALEFN